MAVTTLGVHFASAGEALFRCDPAYHHRMLAGVVIGYARTEDVKI